jgi:pyrroline-5-carboxylate reductase
MPRTAFLGSGNMASAIVEGLLARGGARPADFACFTPSGRSSAALAARSGIALERTLEGLLSDADPLVVAFKPQHLASADSRLAPLTAGRLVISVLAGATLARLSRTFPNARNLVRCMPNLPGRIGCGVTAWCSRDPLSPADRLAVGRLLAALGSEAEVPEGLMDAVTGLSGSGPGFILEFASALGEAGAAAGLPPDTAKTFAAQTLLGTARLLAGDPGSADRLRDQVTSPKGTTAAGLEQLAQGGFRDLVRRAVLAAARRSGELSEGS